MEELKLINSWTHCSNKVPSLKSPALGLGKTQPISYKKAIKNADKQINNSPYYGYVFGDTSEYIGLDIDVDPTGKKSNATTEVPESLLEFLQANPTHVHYSPNGHGLHIIYKLSPETRDMLDALNVKQRAVSIAKGDMFDGDIRYRNSFLVFTENLHELNNDTIELISFDALMSLIPSIVGANNVDKGEIKETDASSLLNNDDIILKEIDNIKPPKDLRNVLDKLPSTFDFYAQRACEQLPYSQPSSAYEYWLLVGNACCYHAILLELCGRLKESDEVFEIWHDWSSQDKENYIDRDDVQKKYDNLLQSTRAKIKSKDKQHLVTMGTLVQLAQNCIFDFPDKMKRGKKLLPDGSSLRNIEALLKFEGMKICVDELANVSYVEGPDHIVKKFFTPSGRGVEKRIYRPEGISPFLTRDMLQSLFWKFMQTKYGYSVSNSDAKSIFSYLTSMINEQSLAKRWIESNLHSEHGYIDKVTETITFNTNKEHEITIYKQFIRNLILAEVGILFFHNLGAKIPAMLVLSGPENTYKTTWAKALLPDLMQCMVKTGSARIFVKDEKDWHRSLCSAMVLVVNECETMFQPKYEASLKASVDETYLNYRNLFENEMRDHLRSAMIVGTTNKRSVFTGSDGTRKIWLAPIVRCHSDKLRQINMGKVYGEALAIIRKALNENKGNPNFYINSVWEMSPEELDIVNRLNASQKDKNIGVMGLLSEFFGEYDTRFFEPQKRVVGKGIKFRPGKPYLEDGVAYKDAYNCWTIGTLTAFLNNMSSGMKVERNAVRYALEEYSGQYTRTLRYNRKLFKDIKSLPFKRREEKVVRGMLKKTSHTYFYLMPTLLSQTPEDVLDYELAQIEKGR